MIRRLVYSSIAAEGITMRDVFDIIRVSHNRNSSTGITGGLIFIDGYFFQLLEGLPSSVQERLNRITSDPRHSDIVIRSDESADQPLFESQWMALRDGSHVDPEVLKEHRYAVGLPKSGFTGDQVFNFLIACFERELAS